MFLKCGISHQPLIRKHSYLDHRYPGGSAFIPWLLTPGSAPQGGARGQNLGHLKKGVFLLFCYENNFMQMVGKTWPSLFTWTYGLWSEGQHDLYFTVQWFCLISWRLFDVCTSYFRIMNQYGPMFEFKVNVDHCDLYFMVQWLCLIHWRLFHVWTPLFGIMNQYDPMHDLKINICHCDLYFMVQWFCLISQRLFDGWVSYFQIMRTRDWNLYLKINIGQHDLYFMVEWFCLISLRLFDVWTSSLWIMGQYDRTFDLKINVFLCDLYFMVHWFCLISQRLIWCMSVKLSGNEIMWLKALPQNRYRSTWPIFHGLVILLNIFKIIWWINIIIDIMDQCDTKIDFIKYM